MRRSYKKIVHFILLPLLLYSCNSNNNKTNQLFTLLSSSATGIDFINQLDETEQFNIIKYLYFNNGAGVASGDINNDGLADIYFTSNQHPNRLYLNKGNLKFEDITEEAGVAGSGDWKTGVTMADINGDGFLDIYICQVGNYKGIKGRNQLFINHGDLKFTEEAHSWGLDFEGFSTQAAFFDYDMDGDLDMYLLNHSVHSSRSYGEITLRFEQDTMAGDKLYRNELSKGIPVFQDVTMEAGIYSSQIGYGLGVNICDINDDGYPDIYVSNDFHENDYIYINNGNSTFTERLTQFVKHTSRSSMGNDVGDINNDGLLDIAVLDMLPDDEKIRKQSGGEDDYGLFEMKLNYGYSYQYVRNMLQVNLGGGMFSEIGRLAGIYSTDWSWSPLFCDVDNDGWKDLFITNGIYRRANDLDYIGFLTGGNRYFPTKDNSSLSDKELYENMPLYPNVNYIFKNNHNLTFTNKAKEWGFESRSYSNGSSYADLDNDGDLDFIVNNINDKAFIFRNNAESQTENHFLSFILRGSGLNKRAVGARIILYDKEEKQVAEQFSTRGFLSATTDVIHFGTGSSDIIDSITVRWPDQKEQTLKEVPVNKIITLDISDSAIPPTRYLKKDKNRQLFTPAKISGLEFRHKEDPNVDFKKEQLIPHSLNSEGPPIAVCDINGDKLEDLFIGGAKDQAAEILIQKQSGSFTQLDVPVFLKESYTEDVDAEFFDADGDGDMDLFIVRGGNELSILNSLQTDLLLINDGNAGFSRGKWPLISHNGSCVTSCDFDADNDIDLFVGSRSVPGSYGWSPFQYLLENDGKGNFSDVTDSKSVGLRNIGMVTDAQWYDFDNDNDKDLVLVGEWMNVSLFRNDNGYFSDVTKSAGLNQTSGWWNCITTSDIDGDGDLDMIGGNLGLNSILKASTNEPVDMFLDDFDNNGTLDQVICYYHNGISYPIASLDELAAQISGIRKKYPLYSEFGGKTVKDIFGKNAIDKAVKKSAVLFESCIFINNGDGTFKNSKLPIYVQFSPVRDILNYDINHDGKNDLIFAGNNYSESPSLGRNDASYGWCLPGDSDNNFNVLMPVTSGLNIDGDARRIRLINIAGKQYLVAAVNNGNLQVFELLK